jgi:tetratricopeptide (TPR) repeat protein
VLDAPKTDSPVYTYLPQLAPPAAASATQPAPPNPPDAAAAAGDAIERSLKQMLEEAHRLMALRLYQPATDLLEALRQLRPHDVDVTQRLAEAIYKSEQPDLQTALYAARELLNELHPVFTNDPQTLTLWGALHKRLWEHSGNPAWLDDCVLGFSRGFALKQDHYTGVNLAFVLDVRAEQAAQRGDMANAITDRTLAARTRRDVLAWCSDSAERLRDGDPTERYWVIASLWEAALGLGDEAQRQHWEAALATIPVPAEMRATREKQAAKLRELAAQAQLRALPTGSVKPFAPATTPATATSA